MMFGPWAGFSLVDRHSLAREAPFRWASQAGLPREKTRAMFALGENPDPDDVDRIVGNPTWTDVPQCMRCLKKKVSVVRFDLKNDTTPIASFVLCDECIEAARALVKP